MQLVRRRPRAIVAVAAGSAITFLMGGLLALTQDSVSSKGNNVETGPYSPPAHSLQIAVIDGWAGQNCASAVYQDADVAAVFPGSAQLDWANPGFIFPPTNTIICLKNAGPQPGALFYMIDNVIDTEVGPCADSEALDTTLGGGGDESCLPDGPGELSQHLWSRMVPIMAPQMSTSANCFPGGAVPFTSLQAQGTGIASTVNPGEVCAMGSLNVGLNGTLDEQVKLESQTDRTTWDYVFTLQDEV